MGGKFEFIECVAGSFRGKQKATRPNEPLKGRGRRAGQCWAESSRGGESEYLFPVEDSLPEGDSSDNTICPYYFRPPIPSCAAPRDSSRPHADLSSLIDMSRSFWLLRPQKAFHLSFVQKRTSPT